VAYNRNKSTLQPAYSDRENSTRINSDSVKNAAKDWVKENRAKGYSNEEMIKNLKKQGWSNEDINWLTKK
jgi:urate oxidase